MTKRYHPPLTPFQRVQAHPAVAPVAKDALAVRFAQLDPVDLLHDIHQAQTRLTALADAAPFAESKDTPRRTTKTSPENLGVLVTPCFLKIDQFSRIPSRMSIRTDLAIIRAER